MRSLASQAAKPSAAADAWRAAARKIRGFAAISPDTDEAGRTAPSPSDSENALEVLDAISQWTNQIPRITPVGDGEITLEWTLANNGYLDITLHENLLVYICQTPAGQDIDGEYEYAGSKITPELEGLIREHLSGNLPLKIALPV